VNASTDKPIAISAGGTGGHLFPAQALAAELIKRGRQVVLLTDPRGHNYAQAFPKVEIVTVPSATFADRGVIGKGIALLTLARGAFAAYRILGKLNPGVVAGFGGYPSLPPLVAASQRRIPTLVHEQNAVLGRVNRFLASRVTAIAASFPAMKRISPSATVKVIVTGNPVRDAILALTDLKYLAPSSNDPFRLLIFGGSQGARAFSQLLPQAIALLPSEFRARIRIEQQCRPEDLDAVRAQYSATGIHAELAPFFQNMGERLTRAHLVICRAGASTVTELMALGRPSILIPYPFAMDDHQTVNANILAQSGGGMAAPEKSLTPERIAEMISDLASNPSQLTQMAQSAKALGQPGATVKLADCVEALANGMSLNSYKARLGTAS
jgi:UDP-N-acetylglucosamine--N-acetylmuramyl-(pentapeptide) pyrophosphoryl-undecaprenol N-acetylglucosamine transferase